MSFFSNRFYFPVFISIILIFGSAITWYTYKNAKEDTVLSLIARTDTVAQLVAEVDLSSLSYSEADLDNPVYQKLKGHFINARMVNEDVRFIYIFVQDGDEMKFVIDSEPADSEDYSPPGQVYEEASEQQEIFDVFATGQSSVQEAYQDRWGTWITALSPIKDERGMTKYVVGVDIDASSFLLKPYVVAAFPGMLSLVLLMLAFMMYFIRKKEMELVTTKAQFVSIASHELRSPLTGIRWSAESLLAKSDLTEDRRTTVQAIQSSSVHLLSVVNDLLSISTAEHDFADKKKFAMVDVKALLDHAILDLLPTAQAGNIKVTKEMSGDILAVNGSAERLQTLFSNLISNAIKYSKKDSTVEIAAGVYNSKIKGKTIRVAVRDSGIGIPKDDIKKVSAGFYRSKNAKTHTVSGTGLGLYMCHKIAEMHGGKLYIDSIEGEGTIIVVKLPFYDK